MAALTFVQMRTLLLARAKNDSTTFGTAAGEEILSAIRYYSGRPFYFLETNSTSLSLSSSASATALPANFQSPIGLRIQVNGTWLGEDDGFKPTTYTELKKLRRDTSAGQPWHWAIFGSNIEFSKVADATYSLDFDFYKGDSAMPSADSDTSVWFDEPRDMIINRALEFFFDNVLHEGDKAQDYKARAERWERIFIGRGNMRLPPGALK